MPLAVLVLHNRYQQFGGEDAVVDAEVALLREAGHHVRLETVENGDITGLAAKAKVFANAAYSNARANWMCGLLKDGRPDIVHIHNFFPLLTPAVHEVTAAAGVPVVQTLHNYRLICSASTLLRNGRICEKCVQGTKLWGVVHGCYRQSLFGSLAAMRMQTRAARHRTWQNSVHRFIALTAFARAKMVEGGLPADRIAIKPNFTHLREAGQKLAERRGALFVGRLSTEKGVDTLLRAWLRLPHVPLTIIGDGPERRKLQEIAPANVTFIGFQDSAVVRDEMSRAQLLILPSRWYEGFPVTAVEAFSEALPILASRIGSLAEVVVHGENGWHFATGDEIDLAEKANALFASRELLGSLGKGAQNSFRRHYTPEINIALLESIYNDAINFSRLC